MLGHCLIPFYHDHCHSNGKLVGGPFAIKASDTFYASELGKMPTEGFYIHHNQQIQPFSFHILHTKYYDLFVNSLILPVKTLTKKN